MRVYKWVKNCNSMLWIRSILCTRCLVKLLPEVLWGKRKCSMLNDNVWFASHPYTHIQACVREQSNGPYYKTHQLSYSKLHIYWTLDLIINYFLSFWPFRTPNHPPKILFHGYLIYICSCCHVSVRDSCEDCFSDIKSIMPKKKLPKSSEACGTIGTTIYNSPSQKSEKKNYPKFPLSLHSSI